MLVFRQGLHANISCNHVFTEHCIEHQYKNPDFEAFENMITGQIRDREKLII